MSGADPLVGAGPRGSALRPNLKLCATGGSRADEGVRPTENSVIEWKIMYLLDRTRQSPQFP